MSSPAYLFRNEYLQIKPLYTETAINAQIKTMAEKISQDYFGQKLCIIPILIGASHFASKLLIEIGRLGQIHPTFCPMKVSSYSGLASTRQVRIDLDLKLPVDESTHLLIVEDILDTGHSLRAIQAHLWTKSPASVRTAVLVDKKPRREVDITVDYVAFDLPEDLFIVGFGIDYCEQFRSIPFIGCIDQLQKKPRTKSIIHLG